MDPLIENIVVLVGFALVLLLINLLAAERWLKLLTVIPMTICLVAAGAFVFAVVSR